jgi:hypothetical protein
MQAIPRALAEAFRGQGGGVRFEHELVDVLDRVVAEVGERIDPFVTASSLRTLETSEW